MSVARADNTAPELDNIPLQICDGGSISFTAHAEDGDSPSQTLTYSLLGGPAGASLHPSTGVFNWTPSNAQNRQSYTFIVRVTDNGSPAMSSQQVVEAWVSRNMATGGNLLYGCKLRWVDKNDHSKGWRCLCDDPSTTGCQATETGCASAGETCADPSPK